MDESGTAPPGVARSSRRRAGRALWIVRFALLRDEIDYLARPGREEEAAATAHELAGLERARAAALRAGGLR